MATDLENTIELKLNLSDGTQRTIKWKTDQVVSFDAITQAISNALPARREVIGHQPLDYVSDEDKAGSAALFAKYGDNKENT